MSKNYLIFGVKRTGNHGMIDWLIPQVGDAVRFFNDRKYALLDFSKEDFDRDEEHKLVEHVLQLDTDVWVYVNNDKKRSGECYWEEYNDIDNIFSFEGIEFDRMNKIESQWLEDMNRGLKLRNPDLVVGNDNIYIIFLRNPWNIAASQIRWSLDRPDNYNALNNSSPTLTEGIYGGENTINKGIIKGNIFAVGASNEYNNLFPEGEGGDASQIFNSTVEQLGVLLTSGIDRTRDAG